MLPGVRNKHMCTRPAMSLWSCTLPVLSAPLNTHLIHSMCCIYGLCACELVPQIRQILEIQQRFEAVASRPQPTPTPSALDALTPQRLRGQEETSPQQSLQGDGVSDAGVAEADKGEDGSDGGESVAKGKVYKARSASSREPVSGVHDSSAAATTAAGLHSPDAAASDKGVGGEEERVASRARAAEHLLAGLPSVWSTEAGPKRTLWGVHDVVGGGNEAKHFGGLPSVWSTEAGPKRMLWGGP
eukprot:1161654-Pelagomonas_calceolata.AAC.20